MNKSSEFRAVARVDERTKKKLTSLARKYSPLTESDIIRIGLEHFLPLVESGKLKLLKQAA